jgi:16S rRNA (guanine527-N7)-methyltransferase
MRQRALQSGPEVRLLAGLSALGLDATLAPPLLAYLAELQKWNRAYNLTAVREPAQMVTRHILDSLSVLRRNGDQTAISEIPKLQSDPHFSEPLRLLDVGSGAGLPGIPLAIARPDLSVTLLDAGGKKARFLRHVQRTLKLGNVAVVEERAERFQPQAPFDVVISRAFAELGDFLEQTAHLAAPDGEWLAMKGKLGAAELKDLPAGFRVANVEALQVPGLSEQRHLVIVRRQTS